MERPNPAEYTQVNVALQEATEEVITGTSPEDAAADYQAKLEGIVGDEGGYTAEADAAILMVTEVAQYAFVSHGSR